MNLVLLNLATSLILAVFSGASSGPVQPAPSAAPISCATSSSPEQHEGLVWRGVQHVYGCGCWAQYRVLLGHTNTLRCVCCKELFRVNL